MTKLVDHVLLIDDDRPTNYYNSKVISKHKDFADICVMQSGNAALEYLINVEKGIEVKPDLIFLDLNMPAMNGWEFLVEYSKLNTSIIKNTKIILLTTSSDPEDFKKSKMNLLVKDFINKPLSFSILDGILEKHFRKTPLT